MGIKISDLGNLEDVIHKRLKFFLLGDCSELEIRRHGNKKSEFGFLDYKANIIHCQLIKFGFSRDIKTLRILTEVGFLDPDMFNFLMGTIILDKRMNTDKLIEEYKIIEGELFNAKLFGIKFKKVVFFNCYFIKVLFDGCNFYDVDFSNSVFIGCNFKGCIFNYCNFQNSGWAGSKVDMENKAHVKNKVKNCLSNSCSFSTAYGVGKSVFMTLENIIKYADVDVLWSGTVLKTTDNIKKLEGKTDNNEADNFC